MRILIASITLIFSCGNLLASPKASMEVFDEAANAFLVSGNDLDLLSKYSGEKELQKQVAAAKLSFSCARLDWKTFSDLGGKKPVYVSFSGKDYSIGKIRKVLNFLEKSRKQFFSGRDRTIWDTQLFLETRALFWRLLGEQLLIKSDLEFVKELEASQAEKDSGRAVIALYHLRRFDDVIRLAGSLPVAGDMPHEKAVKVLNALRGALEFTGRKEISRKVADAINRLKGKAEEIGRPIFSVGNIFSGSRPELAEVSGICIEILESLKETGKSGAFTRARALLQFMAGNCALAAGDNEFAAGCFQKAQKAAQSGYLEVLVEGAAGVCFESLGNYEAALKPFQKSRELALKLGNDDVSTKQMLNLVSTLSALNRFSEAKNILKSALKDVKDEKEELWIRLFLGNIKYACRKENPWYLEDSGLIYKRALERSGECGDFDGKDYLNALLWVNLGNVKRKKALGGGPREKLLAQAVSCIQKGLEAAQKAKSDRVSIIAGANLAELYIDLGDFNSAGKFAAWALASSKAINYFEAQWRAELYLGRIAENRKDYKESKAHYEKAVDIVELYRSRFESEEIRTGFLRDKTVAYKSLVRVLLASGEAGEAFSMAERARAKSALESLGLSELVESLGDKEKGVVELARLLRRQHLNGANGKEPYFVSPVSPKEIRTKLDYLKRQTGFKKDVTPAVSFLFGEPTTVAMVKKTISRGETLIEYFSVGDRLAMWIIDSNGVRSVLLPVSWTKISAGAEDFVSKKAQDDSLAEELGKQLLSPFNKLPRKLLVVPTGILNRVPFEALKFGNSFVLKLSEIRYSPSAAFDVLLSHRRDTQKGKGFFLGLANPDTDYDGNGKSDKIDLSFSLNEIKDIQGHYPGGKTFKGRQATESLLRGLVSGASVCHIACHALFENHDPWSSMLYLAKGNGEDGKLHAWEIMGMDLRNTDLITLSGCETGLTRVGPGDNFIGLPRGFLLAGARTLVASLWSVEDHATSFLMEEFYKGLADHQNAAEALRSAKLKLINSGNSNFDSPKNWAAFVLFGRSNSPGKNGTEETAGIQSFNEKPVLAF